MYMIASLDCKFKTNHENIENILQHYGLRKIQSSLYAGKLSNGERKDPCKNISEITNDKDSVLIFPICENCYTKKLTAGREIKFKNDLFRGLGIEISKQLIISKMKNQKATLTTLNKNKQLKRVYNNREKIEEIITQLNQLSLNGDNETLRMKIMGLEGKASNEYWKGVKHFVPKEICFESRTKKPTDLLNSMLNYGYAILASEITKSILVNGLDPY